MNRSGTSNSNPIQNLNSVNMEVVNDREEIGDDFQNLNDTLLLLNKNVEEWRMFWRVWITRRMLIRCKILLKAI